ncbi:MAG: 4Fe-4S dicluster domain-containing protein [Niameybacter sp.]|uniref:4Fe-4S dicluster domain-containing protein n=1 Tax=Niameybacter sp. TaxID=2033640 RepID=UPI002FC9BD14
MLGGILTQYVFDKMTEQDHPTVDISHCMNHKQRKKVCTLCKTQCEANIYKRPGKVTDWNGCKDCNKCVVVCPSRAIASSKNTMTKLYQMIEQRGEKVWMSCTHNTQCESLKVPCLASIPWEFMAYLILQKQVILDVRSCQNCHQEEAVESLKQQLMQVMEVVGEACFSEHLILNLDEHEVEKVAYSRRELMGLFLKTSKKSVAKLVPDFLGKEQHASGLWYRMLLHNQMSCMEQTFTWQVPQLTDCCWGCGLCEKICPQGALEWVKVDDTVSALNLHLLKCTQCGLCEALCPEGGISGMTKVQVRNLMPATLNTIEQSRCTKCGRPISKGEATALCIACEGA